MNRPAFFSIIPGPVQTAAWIIMACSVVAALVIGYYFAVETGPAWVILLYSLAAVASGLCIASWLLGLGYVYADARRRAMRPVLWVLVALLIPHLLGFLLYFVLREPISTRCPHCGNTIAAGLRFCSWCGSPQTLPAPAPSLRPDLT